MTHDTDPLMAVVRALTDDQQDSIVGRFTRLNPHWRGGGVADILDVLCDGDSDLNLTEPFFGDHPDLVVPGCGEAARAIIWSGGTLDEASVRGLLEAAGLAGESR